jgi:integrase
LHSPAFCSFRLQHLDTPHLDELVTLRLNGEPIPQRAKRGHRSAAVLAYLRARPEGAGYSELLGTFGEPGIKALDRLVSAGDVLRPRLARYVAALPSEPERPKVSGGVSNRTVCAMLTVLSQALATAMKRGLVARNVAQLVDRPSIDHREMSTWTPQQAERFREHVRSDRLYACWLLTLAGWRRSEVLGLAWSAVNFDAGTVSVAQGRVVVRGAGTATGAPKSERSRRTLPVAVASRARLPPAVMPCRFPTFRPGQKPCSVRHPIEQRARRRCGRTSLGPTCRRQMTRFQYLRTDCPHLQCCVVEVAGQAVTISLGTFLGQLGNRERYVWPARSSANRVDQ